MQKESSKVTIHTSIIPEAPAQPQREKVYWRVLPHPKAEKRGSILHLEKKAKQRAKQPKKSLSPSEKLLRNAAVACSLLLVVMALSNINQPWTQQATEGIRKAVTMRIDLDESLGRLSFVRQLMPDTALVFWNMGEGEFKQPVNGQLTHAYSQEQPWLLYQCSGQQPVYAVKDGQVSAVGQGAEGDWTLMIDHENGEQTVYAYMNQAIAKVGQDVKAGAQIGVTAESADSRLYFELRKNGKSEDPTGRLAAQ